MFVPSKTIIASKYLSTILTVHACRNGGLQMTKKLVYSLISAKRIFRTHRPHIDPTSISHKCCSGSLPGRPTHTLKEMRCVRKKTSSVLKPTKAAWKVTASIATKPYSEFDFRHKFSLLVVGPTQCGKTYFVQQILKHNRIVYKEQMSIRIFWCNNQC